VALAEIWKSRTLPFARFVSYVPYNDIIFSQSAYEEFISLEMPVPSQGHYGFHSFPVVD
jgi:hypothetical protein